MNIIKMTTRITTTYEVYFEKNQFTVTRVQLSNNTFKYIVVESYDQPLDDNFRSRLVMELDNIIQ